MSDKGKGWYGDSDRHRKAAKKARQGRFMSAARYAGSALLMLIMLPFQGLGWVGRQLRGTWRNAGRAWDYFTFDNLLPPSLVGPLQWTIETTPKLLGIRDATPWQQVGAAVTFIVVAYLATILSGGVLIGFAILVTIFLLIGLVRHVPAINEEWNEWTAALPIKRDYDLPRWERD